MSVPNFDALIAESLSTEVEPSNYQLDCFVTNELAYNDVLVECLPTGTTGAYVGVGPCQNLTYIGALRPRLAFVVDARIDNLLEHLMFKLLFERAETPAEYLGLLLSRDLGSSHAVGSEPEAVVAAVEKCPVSPELFRTNLAWLRTEMSDRWPLTDLHRNRIDRLYGEFFRRQLDITNVDAETTENLDEIANLRDVISARTSHGINLHFLTDAERYAVVRQLQRDDRVIPLLGNLGSGETTDRINELLRAYGESISTFYVSNIEEHVLQRYRIEGDRITARPNPEGLLTGEAGAAYDTMIGHWARLDTDTDALLIRFFFPGTYRGRSVGMFPHIESDVRYFGRFLDSYRRDRPQSIFETYL